MLTYFKGFYTPICLKLVCLYAILYFTWAWKWSRRGRNVVCFYRWFCYQMKDICFSKSSGVLVIKARGRFQYYRLSHLVVSWNVDGAASCAHCYSNLCKVNLLRLTLLAWLSAVIGRPHICRQKLLHRVRNTAEFIGCLYRPWGSRLLESQFHCTIPDDALYRRYLGTLRYKYTRNDNLA